MKNIIFIFVLLGLLSSCRTKSKLSSSTFINNQKILEIPPHYKLDLPEPVLEPEIKSIPKEEVKLKPKHKFFLSKQQESEKEIEKSKDSIEKEQVSKPKHKFFWSKKQKTKTN